MAPRRDSGREAKHKHAWAGDTAGARLPLSPTFPDALGLSAAPCMRNILAWKATQQLKCDYTKYYLRNENSLGQLPSKQTLSTPPAALNLSWEASRP